ncbi:MAG TPA: nicotinate-nucleotide adenylyltransferase [Candidatus Limnocylindria bacterium]|nr:nicotinate-nucleotide adenylyltransferase [Candidatus Limnocylindria bacterium]
MTRIGVMGGTFDPIHVGHLAIAEEAREALELETVLFVPAGQPPHKRADEVTNVEHRLAMVELAIADNRAFELSRIEIDRTGPSYTVDTLEALARAESDGAEEWPSPELTLILSAETFAELPTWHEPERLFEAASMAVVPREGYPPPDPAWLSRVFPGREARVTYLEGPRLGLSSTAIRARVVAGRSIRYLVPRAVEAWIADHGLYTNRRTAST